MAKPWRNWFHCMGSTYGTWLRGDRRGWRARLHREHVEGDYHTPPQPDAYERELKQSRRLMKAEPVVLMPEQRRVACLALAESLLFHKVELVELCVSATHFHALCRFVPWVDRGSPRDRARGLSMTAESSAGPTDQLSLRARSPRRIIGLAKNWSAKRLTERGGLTHRKVWATRSLTLPIRDREHQLRVVGYIRRHAENEDAAAWSMIRNRR